jgi:hypothetical protein
MLIAAAGDAHGEFDALYNAVARLEADVGREVACVLHVGDFGVWPDPSHLDEATRKHGDSGGFRKLLDRGMVPRRTLFIAGNHEDFDYLQALPRREVLAGLEFLPWGEVVTIEHQGERLRVGGVGGCFGPSDYRKERLTGWTRRHYTRADLQRLEEGARGGLDVLLLHEPPGGEATEAHAPPWRTPRRWTLAGEGQAELVARVRPRVCFTGHLHARIERSVAGVRVVGLHKVPVRGSVLLVDIPVEGVVVDVAEWGGAPPVRRPPPEGAEDPDPFGDALWAELSARLTRWSAEALGGQELDRAARKSAHARLRDEPLRPLLMGALTGADVRALVDRIEDRAERVAMLKRWLAAPWPEPSRVRG